MRDTGCQIRFNRGGSPRNHGSIFNNGRRIEASRLRLIKMYQNYLVVQVNHLLGSLNVRLQLKKAFIKDDSS